MAPSLGEVMTADLDIYRALGRVARRCIKEIEDTGDADYSKAVREIDPRVDSQEARSDPIYNAAWEFADFYIDGKSERTPMMSQVPWEVADVQMQVILAWLDGGAQGPVPEPIRQIAAERPGCLFPFLGSGRKR
jgi:hypothetical protein